VGLPISITFGVNTPPISIPSATHRVLRDIEYRTVRASAPNPEVFFFAENVTDITRYWQFYLRAVNFNMVLERVSAILLNNRMVTNGTGFGDDEPRQNWILREDLTALKLPQWNKVYTSGDARIRMEGNRVLTFDGTRPPPLKPGYAQPERVEDARIEMYLHTPYTTPWLFYDCHNVGRDGSYQPWPNAGLYPGDPIPRTWMPFVSDTPIYYPPSRWQENSARIVAA
jgi:hypothetical protein